MALQLGALRDALLAANVPPEKANAAAEEVASYERDVAELRGDLKTLKWGQGVTFAAVLAILLKLFLH